MGQTREQECMHLDVNKVMEQRRVMEVLTSSVKRRILWHLLIEGPLTAKDVAMRLGVSLPTVLEHLEALVSSGLVRVESIRLSGKKYVAAAECVSMVISISEHARSDEDAIRGLARTYIMNKLSKKDLKFPISVRDVSRVLGVDRKTAAQVAGLLNSEKTIIMESVEPLVMDTLKDGKEASLSELSKKLGVDTGILTMAVASLAERGYIMFTPRGSLIVRSRSEE